MARKKVQLAWIENQTSRKATFRKRRENLIKKVKEISVLAGSDACGIILSPFEGDPPLFYPPSINEILTRFFALPEIGQFKRMVTIESYIKDEISKLKEIVHKERRNVREVEVSYTMNSIQAHGRPIGTLNSDETSELFWYFEELKKKCELRINNLDNSNAPISSVPQLADPSMHVVHGSHDQSPMNDDPWLSTGNLDVIATNNLNENNNGFGDSSNFSNIAVPNVINNTQLSFESYHQGFVSHDDMAGPSNGTQYPQGFFGNNSGY